MSDLARRRRRAGGLARGGLGAARAVPARARHDAHGLRSRSSRRSRRTTAASPGTCRATARRRCRRAGSRSRPWRTRSRGCIDALGETRRARRRPLDGRADRAAHRAAPPAVACARSPCSTRARPSASTAPIPRPGSALRLDALDAGRDAREHGRARAALDHGAGRRRDDAVAAAAASMARISADGLRAAVEFLPTHDVRDAPRRDRARRRSCVVGEHDEETPLSYAEALANGIPGAVLAGRPGRRPHREPRGARRPSTPRCARISTPSRPRDDGVALDRGLRARTCASARSATARSSRCSRSRPAAASSSRPRASPRRCWAAASTTSSSRRRPTPGRWRCARPARRSRWPAIRARSPAWPPPAS